MTKLNQNKVTIDLLTLTCLHGAAIASSDSVLFSSIDTIMYIFIYCNHGNIHHDYIAGCLCFLFRQKQITSNLWNPIETKADQRFFSSGYVFFS